MAPWTDGYLFNQMVAEGTAIGDCVGAMALSPGNFITNEFTFGEAVKALSDERSLVACLAAEQDESPAALCEELSAMPATAVHPVPFIYSGDPHAMFLVDPSLTPVDPLTDRNALDLLLEFLEYTAHKPVASK